MMWLLVLLIVAVIGVAYAMSANRFGEMPELPPDEPVSEVITDHGRLGADELRRVRFPVVVRGYSMRQVDTLLARLAEQLDAERMQEDDSGVSNRVSCDRDAE